MKTRNIVFSLILAVSTARADVGGGSGKPMTPYRPGEAITRQRLLAVQRDASAKMAVEGVRLAGKNATKSGYRVGLVRMRGDDPSGQPELAFTGQDEKGKKRIIPLANVRSFRLLSVKKKLVGMNEVVVEVTEFPSLTPAELLQLNPTYSTLTAKYARKVILTMPDLALAGTAFWSDNAIHVITPLRDLEPGTDIALTPWNDLIWWAIPSVTADATYPYRKVMKK